MSVNLNDLLAEMERSAGLEKTASIQAEVKPAVSAELASVLTKKASADLTKTAFSEGEALAKDLLTKLANNIQVDNAIMQAEDENKVTPTSQGTVSEVLQDTINKGVAFGGQSDDLVDGALDKEAQLQFTENQTMAKSIMQKLAQMVGEPTTTPAAGVNLAGAPVPNQIQMANAEMTAFDDAKVQPLPGTEGTINNILEAIVAGAKAQGGGSDDLINGEGPTEGSAAIGTTADMQEKAAAVSALVGEGMDFDSAVSLVKQAEESIVMEASYQEKIAAVNELTAYGYDFDTAVELVKQAEYEIANEEYEMEKIAAVDVLVGEGYDFDTAVELVKEASIVDASGKAISSSPSIWNAVKGHGTTAANWTRAQYEAAKAAGKKGYGAASEYAGKADEHIGRNKWKYMAGAAGAAGAAGYAAHEKKAAMEELMNEGIDFDTAAEMIKQAGPILDAVKGHGTNAMEAAKRGWSTVKGHAGAAKEWAGREAGYFGENARGLVSGVNAHGQALSKGQALANLAKNRLTLGAAGIGGAAAAGTYAYKNHEKKAAVDVLMDEGYDFDSAVEMVKQAGPIWNAVKGHGTNAATFARSKYEAAKAAGKKGYEATKEYAGKADAHIGRNKWKYMAGTAGAAGAAGYVAHEKKAALDALVAEGIDFDSAIEMVKQAEYEVYGQ